MFSEFEKMENGQWYDANFDSEILEKRRKTQDLCFELNQLKPSLIDKRNEILRSIFQKEFKNLEILSPFYCDFGYNISFGKNCFVNMNSYFMDGAKISIGNNVFIGPSCGFYTANHPMDKEERNKGLEKASPIKIGDNVWIGANVIVMPGVTIGDNCVIAGGSLVVKDIESNCLAGGVICKVIKKIN